MTPADAQCIGRVLGAFAGVRAVYLFGSAASDGEGPASDIDLAVVPADAAVRGQRLAMLTELARAGFGRVDLVILDASDAVLRFHAVRCNRPLYRAPGFDHPAYFSRTLREYFDLEPLLRARHAAYKRRAASG